jgi:hypothetical protein
MSPRSQRSGLSRAQISDLVKIGGGGWAGGKEGGDGCSGGGFGGELGDGGGDGGVGGGGGLPGGCGGLRTRTRRARM